MCYVGGDYANDIFFSYAHGNDDLRRWSLSLSTRLRNSIETLLQVRSGGLAFWTDADLEGNRQLTPNIRTNIQSSAVIIIVMSELYISSPWCQDEAAWFGEMEPSNALLRRSRLLRSTNSGSMVSGFIACSGPTAS